MEGMEGRAAEDEETVKGDGKEFRSKTTAKVSSSFK